MSKYFATVEWQLSGESFLTGKYSRLHEWRFDNGTRVDATASPHIVPTPWTDGSFVDPEEAFVASLSSCHMLFFLSFAAKQGLLVKKYTDTASGVLADRGDGKLAMTEVELNPVIIPGEGITLDRKLLDSIHHAAHDQCFIANSVSTKLTINLDAQNLLENLE